jgi:putative protease
MCELLAPVRDEISFSAVINSGADSIYVGLGTLNMRINSKGISPDSLTHIVKKAHNSNIKVYVVLNTIVYDDEIGLVDELLDIIKNAGADAVICWDFAVINKTRQKKIPIHISTQANISNIESVNFYESLGAQRVVLARELSLEQIKKIKSRSSIEIETFVHGAMCISVSGRCYMSQYLFDASANRGNCYQPCRREYTIIDNETKDKLNIGNSYVLSPKDICTLEIIDKLIDTGIDCFKIEGRSRSPEYISTVTRAYRQAIDAVKAGTFKKDLINELLEQLKSVYNRGFSKGFYLDVPTDNDMSGIEGSAATHKKIIAGKVLNYYPKSQIVFASIESTSISVGDLIQIQGPTTGIIEYEVEDMRTEDENPVKSLEKTKGTFPCHTKVRRNDRIYKIVKNTPHL